MQCWPPIAVLWMFLLAGLAGCSEHDRDMQDFKQPDPRYNREGAPPTGLKKNPARPQSDHPGVTP